ncbi:MAG: hypothetical protein PVH19_15025 [Planctomycetia bacterium]|jgi:hypothetical protein
MKNLVPFLTLTLLLSTIAYAAEDKKTPDTKPKQATTAVEAPAEKDKSPTSSQSTAEEELQKKIADIADKFNSLEKKIDELKQTTEAVVKIPDKTQCISQEKESNFQQKLIDDKLASYEKSVEHQKWAISIIVALLVGSVAVFMFKNRGEYNKAVSEAREAQRKAEQSAEKIRQCEEDAQKKLKSIEITGDKKLKEFSQKSGKTLKNLDEKTKEFDGKSSTALESLEKRTKEFDKEFKKKLEEFDDETKGTFEKAEKQREFSQKWNDALRAGVRGNFVLANALWREITEENPKDDMAFYNWGCTLLECGQLNRWDAKFVLLLACEKFQETININPNKFEAFYNWGHALLELIRFDDMNEEDLLKEAFEKFESAEKIKEGSAAYGLARVWARKGNKEECRKWLKVEEKRGTLITRESAMKNKDFKNVRDEVWFQKIKWAGEN